MNVSFHPPALPASVRQARDARPIRRRLCRLCRLQRIPTNGVQLMNCQEAGSIGPAKSARPARWKFRQRE